MHGIGEAKADRYGDGFLARDRPGGGLSLEGVMALGLALLGGGPAAGETLGDVLKAKGLSATEPDLRDLRRKVTSYAVLVAQPRSLVAYYLLPSDGPPDLLGTLRLALRDERTGRWTEGTITKAGDEYSCLGSAMAIRASAERFLVETHLTPSAACTLVVAPDLRLVDAVPGGLLVPLSNGSFLYQRGQVHFAAIHPLEVALYDARARASRSLYPARPFGPVRQRARAAARTLYAELGAEWCAAQNHPCDPDRLDAWTDPQPPAVSADGTAAAVVVHLEVRDPRATTERFAEKALVVLRRLDRPDRIEVVEVALDDAAVRRRFGAQQPADFLAPRIVARLFERHSKP